MADDTCSECGDALGGSRRRKYCSPRCRSIGSGKLAPCAACGEDMALSATSLPPGVATHRACKTVQHGTSHRYAIGCRCDACRGWMREYGKRYRSRRNHQLTCLACGDHFWSERRERRACGIQCRNALARRGYEATRGIREEHADRERLRRLLPVVYERSKLPPPIVHARTASRLVSGRCRVCEKWFVSRFRDVTCSAECLAVSRREAKRIGKDRRRALQRGAYVADVSRKRVFESDGYRCHICDRKTDKRRSVPHPKAPTIDHIVPLALGGKHEPSNCRTACFQCNTKKSHVGHGDQMLLLSIP